MSARETHVTEFGLGLCAGVGDEIGWYGKGRSSIFERMRDAGLRPDTHACDGSTSNPSNPSTIVTVRTRSVVPTCPRCAVLRDEALEGRLPARPVLTTAT